MIVNLGIPNNEIIIEGLGDLHIFETVLELAKKQTKKLISKKKNYKNFTPEELEWHIIQMIESFESAFNTSGPITEDNFSVQI